ncbi:MAG: PAS domain-containing protein, partial [Sphaerochaetaceae bacterium]
MQIGVLVIGGSEEDKATIRESLIGYALWFSSNEEEVQACINEHQEIQIALFFLHTENQLLPVLLEHAVRTIILSYPGNDKEEIEALALGASDYLRKPLHPEMLRIRINFHVQVIEDAARKAVVTSQHIWFDTFLWQAPVGVAVYRDVNRTHLEIVNANSTLEQILDRTKEELMALNWQSIIHPDDLADVSAKHGRFFRHEIPGYETEKRFIRPDGSIIWVNLTVSRLYTGRYCCNDCVGIIKDITQQKLLETSYKEQEREMSSFLSQLPGMAYRCSFDESWTMQFVSSGCETLIGYTPDELIDNKVISYNEVIVPSYRQKVHDTWSSVAEKDSSIAQEYEIITKDGQSKWVYDTGKGILDKTGQLLAIEGMVFDISEQQK